MISNQAINGQTKETVTSQRLAGGMGIRPRDSASTSTPLPVQRRVTAPRGFANQRAAEAERGKTRKTQRGKKGGGK